MEKDLYSFAEEQRKNLSRVIDVSSGICPLGPSRKVKAAIRKAVRDIDRYPDPGLLVLKNFFRSKFGISENGIMFANSINELLNIASSVFGGDRVVVISNPDRLSGRLTGSEDLIGTVSANTEKGRMVVIDESLIEFTDNDKFRNPAYGAGNVIILGTTANFYALPGIELAWAVSSPGTISGLEGAAHGGPNILSAAAAMAALKDKTYIKAAKKFIHDERRALFYALRKIAGVKVCESDSNVFLLKIEAGHDKVLAGLSGAGFLIKDCAGIKGLDKSFLRMSVMSHDMNRKLIRVLKENCVQKMDAT
jgi:threonine-phosphate decarboxylase